MGYPCQKMTTTNSCNWEIVLLMLSTAVIISSSCSYTTGKSEIPQFPPPPPPPPNKKDSDWSMILAASPGNLSTSEQKIFSTNIQHSFGAIYIQGFVSVLFSQVEFRIKNTNQQQHVHLLYVPSPHNLIEIGHVLPVSLKEQFWRVSGSLKELESLKVLGSLKVPYRAGLKIPDSDIHDSINVLAISFGLAHIRVWETVKFDNILAATALHFREGQRLFMISEWNSGLRGWPSPLVSRPPSFRHKKTGPIPQALGRIIKL